MQTPRILLAAALFAASAIPAVAAPPTQADIGAAIRDRHGEIIGSLHAIQGGEAIVWYGYVTTPGNHLAAVPLASLSADAGRLTLDEHGVQLAQR